VSILPAFERLGVRVEAGETTIRVPPGQDLVIQDDLGGQIPKIEDGPWPAFPADLTSIAVVTATQAHGTVLVFEKMFESRLFFVDKLVAMGARIILCDPHRAVVTGPARLYGERADEPGHPRRHGDADRRALRRWYVDDRERRRDRRGYERIDERLRNLGAQIERVEA
jgi:UDP-N-acetylglucosamine 1-carboxyvinyltransferase